jgi:hypothetical protein
MTDRPSWTQQQIDARRTQVKATNNIAVEEAEVMNAIRAGLPSYAPDKAATLVALTQLVRGLAAKVAV